MYAISVGYYSYADIILTNNIIKKEIAIGDSFRGNLHALDQNTDIIKIGDDCKGNIKTNNTSQTTGCKKLVIGDNFSGKINLNNDECIKTAEIGKKFCGNFEALYAEFFKRLKIGKYYSGNTNLSSSGIESIFIEYGACGTLTVTNCNNLEFIQTTVDNKLIIDSDREKSKVNINENIIHYSFNSPLFSDKNLPLYKKIYKNIYNRLIQ